MLLQLVWCAAMALATASEDTCALDGNCRGDVMLQHQSFRPKVPVGETIDEGLVDEDSDDEQLDDDYDLDPADQVVEEEDTEPEDIYAACTGKDGEDFEKCVQDADAAELEAGAEEEPQPAASPHDIDTMAAGHMGTPEDQAILNVAANYEIYGIDGTAGRNNQCFVKNQQTQAMNTPDNIENTVKDAEAQKNNDGTDRGDWAKCLPPPMYTMMTTSGFQEGALKAGQFERDMKPATDLYTLMKFAHNEACTHIRLDISEKAIAKELKDEINHVSEGGLGPKIAKTLEKVVGILVQQYSSTGADNPENQQAMQNLETAINGGNNNAIRNALNAVGRSPLVTQRDITGTSARRLYRDMYNTNNANTRTRLLNDIKGWMADRPKIGDYLKDERRKQGNNAAGGADGISDVLQNFGMCGARGRRVNDGTMNSNTLATRYTSVKVSLGLVNGDVQVKTKNGFISADALLKQTQNSPLKDAMAAGDVQYPEGRQTYQDDMFSQGNIACGQRADGAWTMTTADRNNNNQNTARPTQEEGYFCLWALQDMQSLPADQRGGFSNTELVAESPEYMAKILGGKPEYFNQFFAKENEAYKYFHCHYAPQNSGALRVYSFQHQAERLYPGSVRQVCSCDWRKIGMLVSRCDCTLDAQENGGCRRVEMQALNEGTQVDLWLNKGKAAKIALMHGDLAEGRVMSYDYQNDNRPDQTQVMQEATGRVRPTTNGNGGNNVVCATDQNGVPNAGDVRTYQRNAPVTTTDANGRQKISFTDQNNNGNMDTRGDRTTKTNRGREFEVKDITAKEGRRTSVPAGGDNKEFINAKGDVCDALKMGADCAPADAGKRTAAAMTDYLSKFCGTSASLYAVPLKLNKDTGAGEKVADGFSRRRHGLLPGLDFDAGNFRTKARAYFGAGQMGDWLFPGQQDITAAGAAKPPGGAQAQAAKPDKTAAAFDKADVNRDGVIDRYEFGKYEGAQLVQVNGTYLLQGTAHSGTYQFQGTALRTGNNRQYKPTSAAIGIAGSTRYALVTVQANSNAHVGFFAKGIGNSPIQRNNNYELVLGGWNNRRNVIRRDGREKARQDARAGTVSANQARDFWISVDTRTGRVAAGTGKEFNRNTMMEFTDNDVKVPLQLGVMTGYGGQGAWTFPTVAGADQAPKQAEERRQWSMQFRGDWSQKVSPVQGKLGGASVKVGQADAAFGGNLDVAVGGNAGASGPSAVPAAYTQKGKKEAGVLEENFARRFANSQSKGAAFARELVASEEGRAEGVTCANGKFVWAKKEADGTRPVVSTVREAFNKNGPNTGAGQWACRYLGAHCNTNNCNNQANTEVADTYVDSNGESTLKKAGDAGRRRRRRR